MFSPKTPIASPRPSPFHTRSSARQTRRNLKNQSSLSVQSFHGPQMLDETSLHKIEAYGLPLPVLITEALTLSDRSTTEITACIDPSGWAWLVGGRKLFVWRYVASNNSKNVNCKELTLPPSDLAHSAERVCVIPNENQSAACVAVSPEGVVRYWPNIAFESNIAEISAELRGEECARVINFYPHGCLLATTTSSLLLLEPAVGQASIQCKPLKASQGLFSGISRRMSSFIFGSSQVQTNGIPLQTILAAPYNDDEENIEEKRSFYVLSGTSICKWQVPSLGTEKLLYQLDAERMFREALSKKIWGQDAVHLTQLKTWLIDLQLTRDGIVMLSAGVNLEADQKIYYALAFFDTSDDAQSVNISNLIVLDYTQKYSEELDEQISAYKLLFLSTEKANTAYVYNNSTILMLSGNSSLDKMDLKTTGDVLLGAGIAKGVAVFFSNAYGFFSVSPTKSDSSILDDSTNLNMSARAELSTFMLNSSKANDLIECSDNKSKLKGTFIASLAAEQNQDQTEEAVSEILTSTNPKSGSQTSELDTIVADISQDLIDDYPNADPRWAESEKHDSTGSTASVILIQQLKDKQKAHDLFVSFLKNCGLWNKINLIGIRGSVMPTRLLLCEHVEKLEAAIALRELHSEYHKILDPCIQKVLKQRKEVVPASLTAQDLFYRKVSNIHEIAQQLVTYEKEFFTGRPSQNIVTTILAVNALLEAMLHHALKYRQDHCDMYAGNNTELPEFIPWTATTAMRKIITEQIGLILEKGLPEAREVDVQGTMFQNIVGLADIFLDGYASQLKSLQLQEHRMDDFSKLEREFDRERQKLILPLLECKQYDRAASLAEKFEDFEILVKICDLTDGQDRLQKYRYQFADRGFSQFLYNWYLKEGKRSHLLSKSVADEELSQFLDSDDVKYLSWLHEIRRGNFQAAHSALATLANVEKIFLSKKKTLLSLSKLSALASEEGDDEILQENIEAINEELGLVLHQEALPEEVLHNVGMDPKNMRVMSPEELIQLYVSEHNTYASELDVKKALDLLHYVEQVNCAGENFEQLKLHILCRAILMDSWDDVDITDPLEVNKNKIFFRTLDLVHMDDELDTILPALDTLLSCEELAGLQKQPNFLFLIKAGYEQIQNALQ